MFKCITQLLPKIICEKYQWSIMPDHGDPHSIGTYNETSIHRDLKLYYSNDPHSYERRVNGYIVDVLDNDSIVEIQTGNFGSIRKKLETLLGTHKVRLVHPIAKTKHIIKIANKTNIPVSKRRSPKKGSVYSVFKELLRLSNLITHPNFNLDVLLTEEEEYWIDDKKGSWRRKGWSKKDRKLISVSEKIVFDNDEDYVSLLPKDLPLKFTTSDVKEKANISLREAQQMCYTFRKAGLIIHTGKKSRSKIYELNDFPMI